jgi:hypothetical protein
MKLDNLMLTKQKFSKLVESIILKNKNMSYLDAVIMVCEKNEIEIEDSKKFISNAIKSKIESEATKLNMMQEKNGSVELE